VCQEEAGQCLGLELVVLLSERAKKCLLFFEDLLDAKIRELNPRYAEAVGASLGQFRHLHSDIYGNREFVEHLRNRGKFLVHDETRELDLILIDGNKAERIALGMVGGAAL